MQVIITIDEQGKYFIESYKDGAVWATAFTRAHVNEIVERRGWVVVADYAADEGR